MVLAVLALGYTVPPIRLSYRGLGELDVALTHSAGALLAGYVVQGGHWSDGVPWLLALPLGLSILPSILLAGCPDRAADQAAGKRTLVVILGPRRAIHLAMAAGVAAPMAAALLAAAHADLSPLLAGSAAGGAVHAVVLWRRLRTLASDALPDRIDGPIVLALGFVLWFCLPPLLILAHG